MAKTYEDLFNAYSEKENKYRVDLRRLKESRADMGYWFAGLQQTLTDAGWDVDLSSPEGLSRFLIVDSVKKDDGSFEVKPKYAFDVQEREFDPQTISGEGWEKSFEPVPSPKILYQLYTAAQNGTLILTDRGGSEPYRQPVQIKAENGAASVGRPVNEYTDLEAAAVYVQKKPVEPKSPSFRSRMRALFGNEKAKAEIAAYDKSYKRYAGQLELWKKSEKVRREHPDIYENAMKKTAMNTVFFKSGSEYGEKLLAHQQRTEELHQKLVDETVIPIQKKAEEQFRQTQKDMLELLNRKASPENAMLLANKIAELCCVSDVKKKMDAAVAGRTGTVRAMPVGQDFKRMVSDYKRTDEYMSMLNTTSRVSLTAIAGADDVEKGMKQLDGLREWVNGAGVSGKKQTEKEYFASLKKNLASAAYAVFATPEQRNEKYPNLGVDTERLGIDDLAICLMLEDGRYSIDDAFDPEKLPDVKKQFAQKAIDMIRNEQRQEIVDCLVNGMDMINKRVGAVLNQLPDLEFHTLAHPKCAHLGGMVTALKGMYQNVNDVRSRMLSSSKDGEKYKGLSAEKMRYKDEITGKSNLISTFFNEARGAGELADFAAGADFKPGALGRRVDWMIVHKAKSDVFRKMINAPENYGKDTLDMLITTDQNNEMTPTDYGAFFISPSFEDKTDISMVGINGNSCVPGYINGTRKFVKELLTDQHKITVVKQGDTYIEGVAIPEIDDIDKRQKQCNAEVAGKNKPVQPQAAPQQQVKA